MSCLFNTLSPFVHITSKELRDNICSYIKTNPKIFDDIPVEDSVMWNGEDFKDLKSYIKHMKKSSSWGGAIEIKAFCNMYNKVVIVRDQCGGVRKKKNKVEFLPNGYVKNKIDIVKDGYSLKLSYPQKIKIKWNGGHYWT